MFSYRNFVKENGLDVFLSEFLLDCCCKKEMQKLINRVLKVLENENFLPDLEVFYSCQSEGVAPQR